MKKSTKWILGISAVIVIGGGIAWYLHSRNKSLTDKEE